MSVLVYLGAWLVALLMLGAAYSAIYRRYGWRDGPEGQ